MPRQTRKISPDPLVRAIVLSLLLCGVLALFIATLPDGALDAPRDGRSGVAGTANVQPNRVTPATVSVPPVLGGEAIENSAASAPRESFSVVPRRVPSVVVGPDGKIISR